MTVAGKGGRPTAERPKIRPRPTDPGILEKICDGLIAGKSMIDLCKNTYDMPDATEIYKQCAKDSDYAAAVARAREHSAHALVDESINIADVATPVNVKVANLRVQTRLAIAAKFNKRYSDRQQIDARVDGEIKVTGGLPEPEGAAKQGQVPTKYEDKEEDEDL